MEWLEIIGITLGQSVLITLLVNLILLNRFDEINNSLNQIKNRIY